MKIDRALLAHILPFVAWVAIMSLPIGAPAWRYALQTLAGAACLIWLKPWRYYRPVEIRRLPAALLVGLAVGVLWVLPESGWMLRFPFAHDLYLRYGVRPLGVITGYELLSPYAPEHCGWPLALVRLTGSAVVIAAAEEFFWRGFILRWLVSRDFLRVDPRAVKMGLFLLTALLFGLEHDRWLAGTVAGLAYGALYVRTNDLGLAVFAHMVTNYLLGLYVLATASYCFW
jgi:CAAX prenyl protease-like protein